MEMLAELQLHKEASVHFKPHSSCAPRDIELELAEQPLQFRQTAGQHEDLKRMEKEFRAGFFIAQSCFLFYSQFCDTVEQNLVDYFMGNFAAMKGNTELKSSYLQHTDNNLTRLIRFFSETEANDRLFFPSHQSAGETEVSIVAQNKDCYESGIVCMKILVIHVGLTKIYFTDNSGNPV